MDSTVTTTSFKAKSGRQLRHLLLGALARWIISLLLCAAWVIATLVVANKGPVTEFSKRIYNAATTGLEHILRADSLMQLSKLVFATRRLGVTLACIFWLVLNIAAQAGIAAVSLTYGFEKDSTAVLLSSGNTSTADMQRFFPLDSQSPTLGASDSYEDESYAASQYGSMMPLFGWNFTNELPNQGQRLLEEDGLIWYLDNNNNSGTYIFFDNSPGGGPDTLSVFTERTINVTYECESYAVTKFGNGMFSTIEVAGIGEVNVSLSLPNATTFFNNNNTVCPDESLRCNVIEVLETSPTQPWYYRCNVSLGMTQNDPENLSFISDTTAYYATVAMAGGGYSVDIDDAGTIQSAQIFPQSSFFGTPLAGNKDLMGWFIGLYSLGSIAVAGNYNPRQFYNGQTPAEGQHLTIGHHLFFYLILALILGFQAIFIIVVAVWANKVKVGEESHLGMAVLMRPIADRLDDIGHGRETKAFKKAKKHVKVKYEKDPITALWSFKMKN
ncbi:hypothetical protein OIDMADRAFT_119695 [Oidiodendron maius Zn]|uniref:Uncharacterized protein n=1 Tax=Oidiodendron maius (strain Zn) TaxID=913774 RepID=A0A0C3H4X6_OIDMZ|nr:hypothetical protein OIDMADRAFT_119695 [Oidiodendron maius Zn]